MIKNQSVNNDHPYIKEATINLYDGIFSGTIVFNPGLNILSGENGTCKTNILKEIKKNKIEGVSIINKATSDFKIYAISPKRNSERKTFEEAINFIRSKNQNIDKYISSHTGNNINDNTFQTYASLTELYYLEYDKIKRDGGNQKEKMKEVTDSFNCIIKSIFRDYELIATWNENLGNPNLKLRKKTSQEIDFKSLSCGEQEILSLVLNVYISRDYYDLFLIDEPEIHLNWHLERKLFDFLDWFCHDFNKQAIVVTHSRIIFTRNFLKKSQFLYWKDAKIICSKEISNENREKIAGDAIDTINLGYFSKPTVFVEDRSHADILEILAEVLGKQILSVECSNSYNVKSIFQLSKKDGGWNKSFFLIDGDNMENPYPNEENFIHLEKYCIECYLFDLQTISTIINRPETEIKNIILELIKDNRYKILKNNKFFDFLIDRLEICDVTPEFIDKFDASEITESFFQKIGMKRNYYIRKYLENLRDESKLSMIFPKKIIQIIESNE